VFAVMASVIHFKFRNALAEDMVAFEGDHVSLADLKRLIAKKKGLLKANDIDFVISNMDTQEGSDFSLLHCNSRGFDTLRGAACRSRACAQKLCLQLHPGMVC
jgi:hypothetical protein